MLLVLVASGIATQPISAQFGLYRYDVFYDVRTQNVYFVDAVTGLSNVVRVESRPGTRMLVGAIGLLYVEAGTNLPVLLRPRSTSAEVLPGMPIVDESITFAWVISAEGNTFAWSVGASNGENTISVNNFEANGSIRSPRVILSLFDREGRRLTPRAISNDGAILYYSQQADPDPGAYRLFDTAADVWRLDTATGNAERLPDEPLCDCADAYSPDGTTIARLSPQPLGGFNVAIRQFGSDNATTIKTPEIIHRQAGDMILSDDGTRAIWASARANTPRPTASERFILVYADLKTGVQRLLTTPLPDGYVPLMFSDGGQSVIIVSRTDRGGTFKIDLSAQNPKIVEVSSYRFLGKIR